MWLTVNSIEWHTALHDANVDELLQRCAPDGVPELRAITKDYIMDILYYGSVATGQRIVDTVASQLNIKYYAFLAERPGWSGAVSILGHSLGSVIVVDLLMHGGTTHRGIAYPTSHSTSTCSSSDRPPPFLIARQQVAFATTARRPRPSPPPPLPPRRAPADAAAPRRRHVGDDQLGETAAAAAEASARGGGGRRAEAAKAAAAGASTVEAAAGGGTIRCQAVLNVFNPVDPVAHLYAPWLGRAPDGAPTVKPVDRGCRHRRQRQREPAGGAASAVAARAASQREHRRGGRVHSWIRPPRRR